MIARSKEWRPRRKGRLHVPFWVGWVALIAGGAGFYLVTNSTLWPASHRGAMYQCRHNAYDCSDFGNPLEAQRAYLACGGLGNDIHRLDQDRDGLACEGASLIPWISSYWR